MSITKYLLGPKLQIIVNYQFYTIHNELRILFFIVRLQIQLMSDGLLTVMSKTEKLFIVSYYREYFKRKI